MDIVRKDKKKGVGRRVKWALVMVFSLTLVTVFLLNTTNASYLANKESLLIDSVKRGDLHINVRGTGVLVPKEKRWIAVSVSGRVERILKKPGAVVKQGELILELSNPHLVQQMEEAKWELQALQSEVQARKVALESELLDQEIRVMNEKLSFERSKLTLNAQQELLEKGFDALSKIDFEEVKMDVMQYEQQWMLEKQRLEKRKENLAAQVEASEARLGMMQQVVNRYAQQVDSLKVTATMDSIIQEVPIELGQEVSAGTNLALLARSDIFIAELRIPEKQIKDVALGQRTILDTRSSKIEGSVLRIDPIVSNGSVQVDIELTSALPKEARPELSVDGVIEINTIPNTLFVRRPMFANSFSQMEIYILETSGDFAVKHPVNFGFMSSQYIQIEGGLKEGEQVIVSDASNWKQHERIQIN
ncbi:efflux RND transporter periplasmic adaptor subunit [Pseudoalteromonas piscicida]|uniref:efflux RND transporter periplasmic adaptor subunit n=1 Tax=Pseudoalteromonas piscicida TaxID=43662 RepID=UPI001C972499|nr:HlyD family efflux transporter periplasmic adaptor subunit [Pseudoalteromonas piscicida]QZO14973.1 HlyD family efflux transporter periplasmic adaptor subunit [Pseudoalteromonas piscicida]